MTRPTARRTAAAALTALTVLGGSASAAHAAGAAATTARSAAAPAAAPLTTAPLTTAPLTTAPLTNLSHLDFLTTRVAPPRVAGHTTYHLATQPEVGALWVYATHEDDGSYTRVGGGTYHPETGRYDQGAFDADDIARAAVVYVRHWRQFGDRHSRDQAYALLRGLAFLQTTTGPHRGNVVLWMQPDGTLNPSALPKETPDPSDSANSYWLARTMWALGEGYAAFRTHDHGFARFLRARMDLAIGALDRDSLSRYGRYQPVDGARTPAWLIVDGADASAEAVLGLASFVRAGGTEARTALRRLAAGIAALGTRPGGAWPYGAVLPSATSRSTWHAWASLPPAALGRAAAVLHRPALARVAAADSGGFDPGLLTSWGPVNGLTPAPTDRSQIAYGVDSRVESLLATARVTGSPGLRDLAGIAAGWFFGQNPAGVPTYDPATGVTADGVSADGVVNPNSGAESTIHGLLTMLVLDAHPGVARTARAAGAAPVRRAAVVVEAEAATVSGTAAVIDGASSAESAWSGGAGLEATGPARAVWTIAPADRPRVLEAVIDRVPGAAGTVRFAGVGSVATGGGGPQGVSAVPGALVPVRVGTIPAGATTITAGVRGGRARLDALLLVPRVTTLHAGAVELAASHVVTPRPVTVPAGAGAEVSVLDAHGRTVSRHRSSGTVRVVVPPFGSVTVVPVG